MNLPYCPECNKKIEDSSGVCFYCGAKLTDDAQVDAGSIREDISAGLTGAVLQEKYRIIQRVIQGARGSVYEAENISTLEPVAVKEILNSSVSPFSEAQVHHMVMLAERLKKIDDQGLPRVTDFFIEQDRCYLVMSFIHGIDMEHFLKMNKGKQTPWESVIRKWFIPLLDILDYVKKQDLEIHYPSFNLSQVMLGIDNQVYVIDFGISHLFRQDAEEGRNDEVSTLGALLYQLLTTIDPREPSREDFSLPDLMVVRPDIPAALGTIVMDMLGNKNGRPASIPEIKTRLIDILAGKIPSPGNGTVKRAASTRLPAQKKISSPVLLLLKALVCLGGLLGSAGIFTLLTGFSYDTMLYESTKILILLSATFIMGALILIFSGVLKPESLLQTYGKRKV